MGDVKQIIIKNRTYYFYNNMISLKSFEPDLLKIDKKHYKGINIYYIGYIAIKKLMIMKLFTLYLRVNHANGYVEKKLEINT